MANDRQLSQLKKEEEGALISLLPVFRRVARKRHLTVVELLQLAAKRSLREASLLPSKEENKSLSKYKRLIKAIDFSERGSKKDQAKEEYKTLITTRPSVCRAIKEE